MILLSANNASTTLGGPLTTGTTTVVLATGAGTLFPSPGANEYFTLTLCDALTQLVYEVCWCTSRTGDNCTVLRAQEGTSARAWLIGDYAYNTLTANSENQARAFSTTNTPTLPFTVPAAHNGATQVCGVSGTLTLPPTSTIEDGFLCPIAMSTSGVVVTIDTNSALVITPSGPVTGTFTITGATQLQWSALASAWLTVSAQATGALIARRYFENPGTFTYTPSVGTNKVIVYVQAAGGAAGSSPATGASQYSCGGNGGSGSYLEITLTSGFSGASLIVGTPGVPASGAGGGTGGSSSFGAYVTQGGQGGGVGGPASNSPGFISSAAGAGGGLPSSGDIRAAGHTGPSALVIQPAAVLAGAATGYIPGYGDGAIGGSNGPSTGAATGAYGLGGCVIVEEYT